MSIGNIFGVGALFAAGFGLFYLYQRREEIGGKIWEGVTGGITDPLGDAWDNFVAAFSDSLSAWQKNIDQSAAARDKWWNDILLGGWWNPSPDEGGNGDKGGGNGDKGGKGPGWWPFPEPPKKPDWHPPTPWWDRFLGRDWKRPDLPTKSDTHPWITPKKESTWKPPQTSTMFNFDKWFKPSRPRVSLPTKSDTHPWLGTPAASGPTGNRYARSQYMSYQRRLKNLKLQISAAKKKSSGSKYTPGRPSRTTVWQKQIEKIKQQKKDQFSGRHNKPGRRSHWQKKADDLRKKGGGNALRQWF